jgi:hypothetical protein
VPGSLAALFASTSDTGSTSAELQTTAGPITAFGRYTRRESVDSIFTSATYTQHDTAAQLYFNLSRQTQLFGSASLTSNRLADATGASYLQISAGAQQQLFNQNVWLRVEGSTSRNEDLATGILVPREAINLGLNGQIARHTTIGVNVYADRAPIGLPADAPAWLTRSTIRVVHSIPTGSTRVANSGGVALGGGRGTGTVSGSVFADWNANGVPDPGEEALAGIPVALGGVAAVTTGGDGQFSFLNVPVGLQQVRLDLNALPVDFDVAAGTDVSLEISRGETRRVSFGLLPLGTIRGRVFEDANRNGTLDAGDAAIDNAVAILDGGQRSELARKGQFRFDAVRAGDHRLELLKESLPEGATILGDPERPASITRDAPQIEFLFLVTIDKRPEVRKVFPPRGGGAPSAAAARRGTTADRTAASAPVPSSSRPRGNISPIAPGTSGAYTIQIAALADAEQARTLAGELKHSGFDAYLIEPPGNGADSLHRVRVGKYPSRASAQREVSRLEDHLGLKLWITRAR